MKRYTVRFPDKLISGAVRDDVLTWEQASIADHFPKDIAKLFFFHDSLKAFAESDYRRDIEIEGPFIGRIAYYEEQAEKLLRSDPVKSLKYYLVGKATSIEFTEGLKPLQGHIAFTAEEMKSLTIPESSAMLAPGITFPKPDKYEQNVLDTFDTIPPVSDAELTDWVVQLRLDDLVRTKFSELMRHTRLNHTLWPHNYTEEFSEQSKDLVTMLNDKSRLKEVPEDDTATRMRLRSMRDYLEGKANMTVEVQAKLYRMRDYFRDRNSFLTASEISHLLVEPDEDLRDKLAAFRHYKSFTPLSALKLYKGIILLSHFLGKIETTEAFVRRYAMEQTAVNGSFGWDGWSRHDWMHEQTVYRHDSDIGVYGIRTEKKEARPLIIDLALDYLGPGLLPEEEKHKLIGMISQSTSSIYPTYMERLMGDAKTFRDEFFHDHDGKPDKGREPFDEAMLHAGPQF